MIASRNLYLVRDASGKFWNVSRGWIEGQENATRYPLRLARAVVEGGPQGGPNQRDMVSVPWEPLTSVERGAYWYARAWGRRPALALLDARTRGAKQRYMPLYARVSPARSEDGKTLYFGETYAENCRIYDANDCLPRSSRVAGVLGYYTDPEGRNTYAPRVMIAGRRKGSGLVLLAGYEDIEAGCYVFDAAPIYSQEQGDELRDYARDAAHFAHEIARIAAEKALEYNSAWDDAAAAARLLEDLHEENIPQSYREAIAEQEGAKPSVTRLLEDLAEGKREAIAQGISEAEGKISQHLPAFLETVKEAFQEGLSDETVAELREWLEPSTLWGLLDV